ncbi:TetR/AcrR family transcriptional regulator [Loktanella salsilacus]|uniref:TetR/AcrR family transcriptional regulator n=1 Tax=Loktanella salsilacus TaxID=195913 RepID=UPI003735FFE0
MPTKQIPDHRTRTAANRREKTRARLVQSAIPVFADKGVDASVIDDVIAAAGVSRGTFYNYFQSNRDLLVAVNRQLGDELILVVKETVADLADPAERVAAGIGLLIQVARDYPLLAAFVAKCGLDSAGPNSLVHQYLAEQIQEGMDQGRFLPGPLPIALDMLAGSTLCAVLRISQGGISDQHGPEVVTMILRGLGLNAQDAGRLAHKPLPHLDVQSACALMCSTSQA